MTKRQPDYTSRKLKPPPTTRAIRNEIAEAIRDLQNPELDPLTRTLSLRYLEGHGVHIGRTVQ